MPPGFGFLDAGLVSVPVFLFLLGLIRGAPVELASCCGCAAGVAVAWLVGCLPVAGMLGPAGAPVAAVLAGIGAWLLVADLSHAFGFDTRWIDLGRLFDSFAGGAMGAARGLTVVSVGCLSYATICVPLGLADPAGTAAYPVFLSLGAAVTHAAAAASEPVAATLTAALTAPGPPSPAPPLPAGVPPLPPLPVRAAALPVALPTTNGPALAALIDALAPSAAAAPLRPAAAPPVPRPYSPVRDVPISLVETHHNILHPFGEGHRRPHR